RRQVVEGGALERETGGLVVVAVGVLGHEGACGFEYLGRNPQVPQVVQAGCSGRRVPGSAFRGMRRRGSGLEQRLELARAVQRGEVVVAAYVRFANVDLGNRPATRAFHHDGTLLRVQVDTDL